MAGEARLDQLKQTFHRHSRVQQLNELEHAEPGALSQDGQPIDRGQQYLRSFHEIPLDPGRGSHDSRTLYVSCITFRGGNRSRAGVGVDTFPPECDVSHSLEVEAAPRIRVWEID